MREYGLRYHLKRVLIVALGVFVLGGATAVHANTSTSPNYQITEAEFGAGGTIDSCSVRYCARASIGSVAAGGSGDGQSTASFGAIEQEGEPLIETIIEDGESDLGDLSTDRTSTKIMRVHIRSYLSGGYTLQIIGDAPKYEGHALRSSGTPGPSTKGVEQFALNAVANPVLGIGQDPVRKPSDEPGIGAVEDKYRTPDMFAYRSEDVIARSDSESGQTLYTISMILNVAGSTPAGHYVSDFSAVVIPTF